MGIRQSRPEEGRRLRWSMNGLKRNDYARLTKRKVVRERNESAPLKEQCASDITILPKRDIMILFQRGLCMPRGRKTSFTIRLMPAQRQTLLAWQRAGSCPFFILERISRVERQRL